MTVALFATLFRNRESAQAALRLIESALTRSHNVLLAPPAAQAFEQHGIEPTSLSNCEVADAPQVPSHADFVISLGGDGTFLRAARWSGDSGIPVVGVNMGHLGYLSSFNPDDLPHLLDTLARGEYRIEHRALLQVLLPEGVNGDVWPFALNEIAFLKQDSASMINVSVTMNGRWLATYRADGLIVSTPTGSTGYNLSVGGPILQPTVPVWVLSPIADHSLSMRPMVISNDSKLEITATGRTPSFRISLDGNSLSLPTHSPVTIVKAPFTCRVVMKKDSVFADSLKSKLLWGESSFKPDDGLCV